MLFLAGLAAAWLRYAQTSGHGLAGTSALTHWFHLDDEANVPTWFAAGLWILNALAAFAVARVEGCREGSRGWWQFLGALFLLLSIDETISLHERLGAVVGQQLEFGNRSYFAWVIPAGFFLVALGGLLLRFFLALPGELRRGLLLAGGLYVAAALGCEIAGALLFHETGPQSLTYLLLTVVEETGEIAGEILCLQALLRHLEESGAVFAAGGRG